MKIEMTEGLPFFVEGASDDRLIFNSRKTEDQALLNSRFSKLHEKFW